MASLPSSYFPQTIVMKRTRWVREEKSPFLEFHLLYISAMSYLILWNMKCRSNICTEAKLLQMLLYFLPSTKLCLCVQHSLGNLQHFAIKNSYGDFYLRTANSQATYRVFLLITHSSHSARGLVVHLIHSQTVASLKEASVWNMFILHHGAVTREAGFNEFHFIEFHSSDFN